MTNSEYLFDWDVYDEPQPVAYVPVIIICEQCGAVSPNETMHMINHSIVFTGQCSTQFWAERMAARGL